MKTDKIVQQKIAQLEAALNALVEPKGECLTNCMTTFNGKQVSIRSLSMPALMLFAAQIHQVENALKETYLRYSVELPKELIHDGYPIKSWENDITFLAKRIQYNEQKAKLNNMIKRLAFLGQDGGGEICQRFPGLADLKVQKAKRRKSLPH